MGVKRKSTEEYEYELDSIKQKHEENMLKRIIKDIKIEKCNPNTLNVLLSKLQYPSVAIINLRDEIFELVEESFSYADSINFIISFVDVVASTENKVYIEIAGDKVASLLGKMQTETLKYYELVVYASKILTDTQILEVSKKYPRCCIEVLNFVKINSEKELTDMLEIALTGTANNILELTNFGEDINSVKEEVIDIMIENGTLDFITKVSAIHMTDLQLEKALEKICNHPDSFLKFIKNNIMVLHCPIKEVYDFVIKTGNMEFICKFYKLIEEYTTNEKLKSYLECWDNENYKNECDNEINNSLEKVENIDIRHLYKYLIISGSRNKDLINKIVASRSTKYIILVALYIDTSLKSKIFSDDVQMLYYILSSDVFNQEEKDKIKSDIFKDFLNMDLQTITDSTEENINSLKYIMTDKENKNSEEKQ